MGRFFCESPAQRGVGIVRRHQVAEEGGQRIRQRSMPVLQSIEKPVHHNPHFISVARVQCGQYGFFVREVLVQGADRDSRPASNAVCGGAIVAVVSDRLGGRLEDSRYRFAGTVLTRFAARGGVASSQTNASRRGGSG